MQMFRGYDQSEPRYGYSAFSESYASKSEQVVEYGGLGGKPYKIHKLLHQPTDHSPKKGDKVRPGSAWNNVPPSKNHLGKYNNNVSSDDESDDDRDRDDAVVCDENGYCYPKPKHSQEYQNPNNYPNGNGYSTPPYYEKRPNPPIGNHHDYTSQPYYEKRPNSSGNHHDYPSQPYYEKRPNSNGYSTPPPHESSYYETPKPNGNGYTIPHPQPQPYYEAVPNNKAMVHKPLPSVKTRLDRPNKGSMESQLENMRINSPKSSSPSPRSPYRKDQGYHETIDSAEARRRYGGASVGAPREQYKGTIDSQEAAKRYDGIFVNY